MLSVGGVLLRRWGRPKTAAEWQQKMAQYSARGLPSAVAEFGTGLVLQTDVLSARNLVGEFLAAKPKRFVPQADGTWTVRGIEPDDLVIELAQGDLPELRTLAFRDHNNNPIVLAEWRLLKMDIASQAKKAGIATAAGAPREFTRREQLSPTSWRWLPA